MKKEKHVQNTKFPLLNKLRTVRYEDVPPWRHIPKVLLLSLILALLVEGFNQGSIPRMWTYLTTRTGFFLLNWLIIFASLSVAELFKRRTAVICTLSALWLGLGFADFMVISDRTQPLLAGDLIITPEIFGLITVYFTPVQIVAIFAGGSLAIAFLLMLYSVTKRRKKVHYIRSIAWAAAMIIIAMCTTALAMQMDWISDLTSDRVGAFRKYGFTTSFALTCGGLGIDEPEEYSTETVGKIMGEIDEISSEGEIKAEADPSGFGAEDDLEHPNVIFLQLESMFDVDTLLDTELSADPMPNYHELLNSCPTAELYVPAVGGGTANVEFEIMSGMDMDFFGAGEAPYNTIVQEVTCESIASIMHRHGYITTAMHNNTGKFFSRNEVYANLGFDRFDSLEYMPYPEYNSVGWAHDSILIGEIARAMDTTEERDMIFAISVASHGKYADTYTYQEGDIEVLRAPEEINLPAFQNYVNLIADVDVFLGDLIEELENSDEPVLLIIYGDHLPSVGLNPEMLSTGSLYTSRYIVWNNYGADYKAENMEAYRLGCEVLRELGISDGVLPRFHQSYAIDERGEEYLNRLQTLEYDLLYGDQEAYGEAGAPERTELRMGLVPIEITDAEIAYGRLMVTGEGFTEYSKAICDEEVQDTIFIDDRHIVVAAEDLPNTFDEIRVAQINNDGNELSRTEPLAFRYSADGE